MLQYYYSLCNFSPFSQTSAEPLTYSTFPVSWYHSVLMLYQYRFLVIINFTFCQRIMYYFVVVIYENIRGYVRKLKKKSSRILLLNFNKCYFTELCLHLLETILMFGGIFCPFYYVFVLLHPASSLSTVTTKGRKYWLIFRQ